MVFHARAVSRWGCNEHTVSKLAMLVRVKMVGVRVHLVAMLMVSCVRCNWVCCGFGCWRMGLQDTSGLVLTRMGTTKLSKFSSGFPCIRTCIVLVNAAATNICVATAAVPGSPGLDRPSGLVSPEVRQLQTVSSFPYLTYRFHLTRHRHI